ncbi:hypothetical protein KJ819_01280 [Patescibacteria group bacterium]|nr:hypothetical protein [Patescibacteria group bacterium]MBU1500575.1 hypothetical protein [Patescibacteria group bacterium]MBU2080456.1 hypothetical protein [Patescibacteria group bacterium]MBU2123739.1 hypothetical protein [Patescibacteria group bacterium]MBU2194595.1 hypothetical protein [Patescibacteria group bacterium]
MTTDTRGQAEEPVPHADVTSAIAEITEEFGEGALAIYGGLFQDADAMVRRLVGSFG